jgi:hypothetical protein
MSTRFALGAALAGLLAMPAVLAAQQQQAAPAEARLWTVVTFEVDPADAAKFQGIAEKIVRAAGQASIDDEYGWTFWNNWYTYTLVSRFDRAELDNPELWMKRFEGTPGRATLMEAFQELRGVTLRGVTEELLEVMPEWGYTPQGYTQPATMPATTRVHVHEFWLKPGVELEWNALVKDFMTFFGEIGYPYPIEGHRVRFGEGRSVFVTVYTSPGEYFGPNSIESLAQARNAGDRWGQLIGRMSQLVARARDAHHMFVPGMSYMGPTQQAAR